MGGVDLPDPYRERADHLRLFPMTQQNSSRFGTAFTETIEAREGVTTGFQRPTGRTRFGRRSIRGRAIRTWRGPDTCFRFVRVRWGAGKGWPDGGVVDLARLAGLNPSGVICEIMRDDGEMARIPDLIPFAASMGCSSLRGGVDPVQAAERALHRACGESRIQTKWANSA